MDTDKLHDIISQQNMLIANAMNKKPKTPDEVVGDNSSLLTMDKTEAANKAASEQDVGDYMTESAKQFPQQLLNTNQAIENETGSPTLQDQAQPIREPSSILGDIAHTLNPFAVPRASVLGGFIGRNPIDPETGKEIQPNPVTDKTPSNSPITTPPGPQDKGIQQLPDVGFGRVSAKPIEQSSIEKQTIKDIEEAKKNVSLGVQSKEDLAKMYGTRAVGTQEAIKEQMDVIAPQVQRMDAIRNEWQATREKIVAEGENLKAAYAKQPQDMVATSGFWGKLAFVAANLTGMGGIAQQIIDRDLKQQIMDRENGIEKEKGLINLYMKQGETAEQAYDKSLNLLTSYAQLTNQYKMAGIAASPQEIMNKVINDQNAVKLKNNDAKLALIKQEAEVAKASQELAFKKQGREVEIQKSNIEARGKEAPYNVPTGAEQKAVAPLMRVDEATGKIKQIVGGSRGADFTKAGTQKIIELAMKEPGLLDPLKITAYKTLSGMTDEEVQRAQEVGKLMRTLVESEMELNIKRPRSSVEADVRNLLPSIGGGPEATTKFINKLDFYLKSRQAGEKKRVLEKQKINK